MSPKNADGQAMVDLLFAVSGQDYFELICFLVIK